MEIKLNSHDNKEINMEYELNGPVAWK